MKKHKHTFWRRVLILILGLFGLSLLHVTALRFINPAITPLMLRRKTEARREGKTLTLRHQWVPLEEINPEMVRAVMASEDNLYLKHHGFSRGGIERAINEYKKKGKVRHGGSTISQQTAKNVFTMATSKSWLRKGVETYYTILIELIWGKRRIMEVYLNVAELGDGVFGVEAASLLYFHHPARSLSRSESALLAVCLPNPRKLHANRPSAYVRGRQSKIVVLMPKLGKIEL